MATITAALVKELREKTGAGMMDCKNALSETNGDIEAAVDWLRKKGLAKAAKKSGRIAADGLVGVAVEANFGVVVEVNSETDFVARNDDFQALVRGILAVALDKGAERRRRGRSRARISRRRHGRGRDRQRDRHHRREHHACAALQGCMSQHGAIGHYVHGQIVDGLGRIGVIVALESTGEHDALVALGRQIAMHVAAASPIALDAAALDPAIVAREKSVLADKNAGKPAACAGEDRRIRPEDLLQGSLPARSVLRASIRRRSVAQAVKEAEEDASARRSRSRASCATRSAKASKNRREAEA